MKLRLIEKIAYGCGDFAGGLIFNAVTIYLMYFYTETLGISAAAASLLLFLARFWDALIDPVMGIIADSTHSRWGRYRPYLLLGAFPLAIAAVLAYVVPDVNESIKLLWAYATYFLLMVAYTAVNIPYASLPAVMTSDAVERTQLTSFRMSGSFTSGILVNMLLFPLVTWFTHNIGTKQSAYSLAIGAIAILTIIGFWFCFSQVRERVAITSHKSQAKGNIAAVIHSRAWWFLLALGITMFSFNIFAFYSGLYYLKYVFGDDSVASTFFTTLTVGMLAGSISTMLLVKWFNKRTLAVFASFLSATAAFTLYFIPLGELSLLCILGFCSFYSVGVGAPVLWALVADTADEIELKQSKQVVALTCSALSFSMKAGMGIGGALVGLLLTLSDFQAGAAPSEQVTQTITSMISLIPAIGNLFFAALLMLFPISLAQESHLQSQLALIRAERT